ncbi:hypothetical protein WJX74_002618 [Apatococcus lobatus]|uniref:hydroxyacylglutathione hydrolase n=2 Tax=Apatococcus TaxID=904362 RepID=A0AAW1T3W3_9CHLO
MRVVQVPVLSDNYAYLLIGSNGQAAAVDPVEPEKVLAKAQEEGVKVTRVLTTHHHWDHAGGNQKILGMVPGLQIVGGIHDNVEACTSTVQDNDEFQFAGITIRCLETPFHTQGHICYFCTEPNQKPVVFTGDTLFVGGCGRCFVGTPSQMFSSLVEKLSKLPEETAVYCGHEYTVSNLKFGAHADKENKAVHQKLAWAEQQRSKGLSTIPSTIGEELQHNVFLRCSVPDVAEATGKDPGSSTLAELRWRKDNWGLLASATTMALLFIQMLPMAASYLGLDH